MFINYTPTSTIGNIEQFLYVFSDNLNNYIFNKLFKKLLKLLTFKLNFVELLILTVISNILRSVRKIWFALCDRGLKFQPKIVLQG